MYPAAMKNVTLTAREELIEAARKRARSEDTDLQHRQRIGALRIVDPFRRGAA